MRGTQSFVHTLTSVWRRPALTAVEIGWRWVYGIPAGLLVAWQLRKVLLAATGGTMDAARLGLDSALLNDPVGALTADPAGAAGKFAGATGLVLPGLEHVAVWLGPALLAGWVAISAVGRGLVLRRADARMQWRPGTLMVLHALRAGVLAAVFCGWFVVLQWIGRGNVTGPIARGEEPNLVLYCALAIVTTLGLFTAWALASWPLTAAPLLATARGLGAGASLREAARLGPVRGRLMEVNLVMGIVKIALIVLAMVFSATPLPFQDVATREFLGWWWAGVGVLWLLWSDLFHVVRLIAYLDLWRGSGARSDAKG